MRYCSSAPQVRVLHKWTVHLYLGMGAVLIYDTTVSTPPVTAKQALVMDDSVAPYVCGYVIGSIIQMPGTTERYTMEVDDDLCGSDAVISMVTMAGKHANGIRGGTHQDEIAVTIANVSDISFIRLASN